MKKKVLLFALLVVALASMLAIAVGAKAVYKDTEGNTLLELEFYTADDGMKAEYTGKYVVKSYTEHNGGLAKLDSDGNHLTWYLADSTKYVDGNVEHTVDCFKTVGEDEGAAVRGILSNGTYSYVGVDIKRIVSANFPDNAGITKIASSYGGYNSYSNNNLLFFYGPNTLESTDEGIFQETPVLIAEFDEETPITALGKKICHEARNLRSFNVPAAVTMLQGDNEKNGTTFYNCISLEKVTFSRNSKLQKTGNYEFFNCYKLTTVEMYDNNIEITLGQGVFGNCLSLMNFVLPDSVVEIGWSTFTNTPFTNSPFSPTSRIRSVHAEAFWNTAIEEFVVPAGLATLPKMDSSRFGKLKRFVLHENTTITAIADDTFNGVVSLQEVVLPDTIVRIGNRAFKGTGIVNAPFTANSMCTEIGTEAFANCKSLVSVVIPKGITILPGSAPTSNGGAGVFSGCSSLTSVVFDYENGKLETVGEYAFSGCSSLVEIRLPNTVKYVQSRAFQYCSKLVTLNFGEGLERFVHTEGADHSSLTFSSGSLKYIYIPGRAITVDSAFCHAFGEGSCVTFFITGDESVALSIQQAFKDVSNTNQGNCNYNGKITGATLYEYDPSVDYTAFATNKKQHVIIYNYNRCLAFYEGVHGEQVEHVEYANGFALGGEHFVGCGRCNEGETNALSPIISALGFSLNSFSTDRLRIASGYNVEVELVELYEKVTLSKLEIGVVFASKATLDGLIIANGGALPQTLNGMTHFSDHMERTYSQYSFKIEFPSPENDPSHYASYSLLPFAVSAFINETHTYDPGHIYTYYQTGGMVSDGTVVDGVVSGAFEYTTINAIYQNIKK